MFSTKNLSVSDLPLLMNAPDDVFDNPVSEKAEEQGHPGI